MTSKTNALRLADLLESDVYTEHDELCLEAAQELRNLHELLGKANALARIRAQRISELEELFPGDSEDVLAYELGACAAENAGSVPRHDKALAPETLVLEPVPGDLLPAVGSRVFIRHGRDNSAHACIVVGYYAWPAATGFKEPYYHRVFVRLVYEGTMLHNSRMLSDCWPTAEQALAAD